MPSLRTQSDTEKPSQILSTANHAEIMRLLTEDKSALKVYVDVAAE